MTLVKFALCLTCLCLWITALATDVKLSVRQEGGFKSANAGDRVTLRCFREGNAALFLWYKQNLGQKPRLISTFYKYEQVGTLTGCHCQCEGFRVEVLVHQSVSGSIQPGGSVTLNCTVHTKTCDGAHSVYWFSESYPGIIYTRGRANDQCERKPGTQTHTCVHDLPNKSLDVSRAGTDYCAVASCGHILFGDGNKSNSRADEVDSFVPVYLLSAALAFTVTLAVLLTFLVRRILKADGCTCTDSQARFSAPSTANAELAQDADNLHYAALRKERLSGARRQNDDPRRVYSTS